MNLHVQPDNRTLLPRGLIQRRGTAETAIVEMTKAIIDVDNRADQGGDDAIALRAIEMMDRVRHEAAKTTATTPQLALLQLAMAIGEIDRFCASWIACSEGDDSLNEIQRLAMSAFAVMQRELGINREDIGADYFVGQRVSEH